jgi:hypothetical protein
VDEAGGDVALGAAVEVGVLVVGDAVGAREGAAEDVEEATGHFGVLGE